ncbi:hypothetical protein [Leptospira kanakyensis]|uniref:Cys-rich protein n=1 Tax=Leptospira kanakyensis TaxID=2484968 RepID=A0A6N4Q7L2_9LEPT|nr:hypothetical protein [Leptospira kanakyensis]MCW7468117.1 hypothetical protein [Leptospira kanakyensis]TGK49253.1 hypothetical protein EHQ11_14530 [Leptospira kanakyensis]TGK60505.1 hypothetical protein EHQ16_10660 [Leptospira kanakyensis]TGK67905.1 hypothetical protein EHQ18_15460 [Leptospira kanakyensis]
MRTLVTISFALMMVLGTTSLVAEDCFLCGSGSSNGCEQCRGKDRKVCEAKGCKISGTSSCSTAANVKVCHADHSYKDLTFLETIKQNHKTSTKTN